jgi:hypothetical protein
MSPFILIDLARAVEDDRRREARTAITRRRLRRAAPSA